MSKLPIQELLNNEYLKISRFHENNHALSEIPHRHDHYAFILCMEGFGKHKINFTTFELIPNRLFFIQKGQVHVMEPFKRAGWLLLFGDELFNKFLNNNKKQRENGILDSYTVNPYIDLNVELKKQFLFIIEQLSTELNSGKQDLDIILHYASLFILLTNRAHMVQHEKPLMSFHNREVFQEVKALVEKYYKEQHLASFYSSCINMDIKKINKICSEATGNTLFKLLQERLVTESKIELQTSSKTIKEISYELGFNDPAFFGRFFKQHTGLTPAAFRTKGVL